jgi:hypothetical protein
MNIPRQEHPKPQFMRKGYINLNGQWQFEIDNGLSGEARGLCTPGRKLNGTITVPFCPESKLSGGNGTKIRSRSLSPSSEKSQKPFRQRKESRRSCGRG